MYLQFFGKAEDKRRQTYKRTCGVPHVVQKTLLQTVIPASHLQ